MWGVLWFFGGWVAKAGKCFGHIVGHGEIDGSIFVVPLQVDAAEDSAVAVNGEVIVLNEVIGVSLANNFDSKVINNKVENGGAGDVTEEARCVACWDVAVVCKVLDKFDVCESS